MKYIFYFFLSLTFELAAQALPPIQNFYPQDYHGESQNWSISQAPDKLIYVANSKGLLQYNGAYWSLYPSPNESIMRSVQVVGDRIYTGCFMEFGYWTKNGFGGLNYTSLSGKMNVDLIEDEEFWTIINVGNYIVFQSLKRIYIYNIDDDSVNVIESDSKIIKMFRVGTGIYFQRLGEGLFKITSGSDFLVCDDDLVKNDEAIQVFGSENDLLILTRHNGFYNFKDGTLKPHSLFPNDLLSTFTLYGGIRLRDNGFLLGTISNGMIYLDRQGRLIHQINQNNGLSNNTVLALFEDVDQNIWLGLDHGISYVNLNAPYRFFNDYKGDLGSIYAAAVHSGNLYVGTNQGLFYKPLHAVADFEFIKGTQGQVWALNKIAGKLYCGHHSGTFLVDDDKIRRISNVQGTWNISGLGETDDLLLQGNYDGLYVLEKSGNTYKPRNKVSGFNNSSRYFETLGNTVFVNHEYNGLFEVRVDDSFSKAEQVKKNTLLKGANSGLVRYKGDLLYAYKKGVLKYNGKNRTFEKDTLLNGLYSEENYESGKLIVADNKLWVFTKSHLNYVASEGLTDIPKIERIPLTKEIRDGILGYENIIQLDDDGNYLLGKTSGFITFNSNEIRAKDFEVHIAKVVNGLSKTDGNLQDLEGAGSFQSDKNDFNFSFYAPEHNKYLITQYQYRLKGMYETWSMWSEDYEVIFENLPFGDYLFEVRAKIGDTISKNTASYSFTISKPWYVSNLMIVLYALGALAFSLFVHMVYKRHYKKQREKLLERNKRELKLAKVQSEKEIIKIKNARLKLENKSKGKELAASTMSIIKKNELLTQIKEELKEVENKEGVDKVIQVIDANLKQGNDWEMFKEAFDNADSGFLKKVKTMHPSLSPNDLKLCAYLRLNLSSKEIAQLLHISPRSVEIKRYRLRKKLGLQHKDNLVNYVLGL